MRKALYLTVLKKITSLGNLQDFNAPTLPTTLQDWDRAGRVSQGSSHKSCLIRGGLLTSVEWEWRKVESVSQVFIFYFFTYFASEWLVNYVMMYSFAVNKSFTEQQGKMSQICTWFWFALTFWGMFLPCFRPQDELN